MSEPGAVIAEIKPKDDLHESVIRTLESALSQAREQHWTTAIVVGVQAPRDGGSYFVKRSGFASRLTVMGTLMEAAICLSKEGAEEDT